MKEKGREIVTEEARRAIYRRRLLSEREELLSADAAGAEDRQTVILDQQSVGRLSRMDALQRQAMASAQARRRAMRVRLIDAALRRIAEDEFGYCEECGEEIPPKRLDLDPTMSRCISCASG